MSLDKYELLNQERKFENKVQRVAAYCRVSTDNRDQANSFESQQKYFKEYIENHPDWELSEIFADKGVSGTSTKHRKEFLRMMSLRNFMREEDGKGTVEIVLIIVVLIALVALFKNGITSVINTIMNKIRTNANAI